MENKNSKTTFAVVHGGTKRLTRNNNLIVIISGIDDLGKVASVIFYANEKLSQYLVNEPHEIKRGLPFDKSEWKRSNDWDTPAVKLSRREVKNAVNLWKDREKWIAAFIQGDTNLLREKNNKDLVSMGIKPVPVHKHATNTLEDFFKKSQKSN